MTVLQKNFMKPFFDLLWRNLIDPFNEAWQTVKQANCLYLRGKILNNAVMIMCIFQTGLHELIIGESNLAC